MNSLILYSKLNLDTKTISLKPQSLIELPNSIQKDKQAIMDRIRGLDSTFFQTILSRTNNAKRTSVKVLFLVLSELFIFRKVDMI